MSRNGVLKVSRKALCDYLSSLFGKGVEVCGAWVLGSEKHEDPVDLKGFGYGLPYVVEFKVEGKVKRVVLETLRPEGFGHDNFADRAQVLLWQHSTFNKLPKHVRSVDVGLFDAKDESLLRWATAANSSFLPSLLKAYRIILTWTRLRRLAS